MSDDMKHTRVQAKEGEDVERFHPHLYLYLCCGLKVHQVQRLSHRHMVPGLKALKAPLLPDHREDRRQVLTADGDRGVGEVGDPLALALEAHFSLCQQPMPRGGEEAIRIIAPSVNNHDKGESLNA